MPLYPSKVLRARERALTLYFFAVFSLDSHLSPSRSQERIKLHPSPPILCLEQTIFLLNPKMAQLFMSNFIRFSHYFRQNTTHIHPSTHMHRRELPSHLNCLALFTTWSCSLGANLVEISLACKYAMIGASS